MKKLILLFFVACTFIATSTQAQTCDPDTSYVSLGVGVYPLPDTTGGVDITLGLNAAHACPNEAYDFTFTAVVPEEITVSGATVPLEKVTLETSGAVDGMPIGLAYACNPPDCVFPKNTEGCVNVYGTPTDTLGNYPLTITATATVLIAGFPIDQEIEFPSDDIAPGEYTLYMDCGVVGNSQNLLTNKLGVSQNSPNPVRDFATITLDAVDSQELNFSVYNVLGQTVRQEVIQVQAGQNTINFDATNLDNGIYFYSFDNGVDAITNRMVVTH